MANIKAIIMPKWGLEMVEGTLAKWHVAEGQPVDQGQPIMDVETEKIANEVEADVGGVLRRVADEGQVIPVGGLLGVIAAKDASEGDVQSFIKNYRSEAVGYELGLRGMDICTGCGPGAMKGPMKGATIAHAKQRIGNG